MATAVYASAERAPPRQPLGAAPSQIHSLDPAAAGPLQRTRSTTALPEAFFENDK